MFIDTHWLFFSSIMVNCSDASSFVCKKSFVVVALLLIAVVVGKTLFEPMSSIVGFCCFFDFKNKRFNLSLVKIKDQFD